MDGQNYSVTVDRFDLTYQELEPLYRKHFAERKARYDAEGISSGEYNPQLETYFDYARSGILLTFIARTGGEPIGYSNIYVVNDMHDSELIAQEDAIYVLPQHRGAGAGDLLVRTVHQVMKDRNVKRLNITTSTDLKVANWLMKHGYKHTAHCMTVSFEE